MNAHLKNHALITIGCQLVRDEEVHQFGIVETDASGEDGKSGIIEGFKEKPSLIEAGPHRMASTGFYIFSPQAYPLVLEAYQEKKHKMQEENPAACDVILDFAQDVFPKAFAKAIDGSIPHPETGKPMKLYAQMVEGYWSDIGNPIQYFETLHDIYAGKVDLTLPTPKEDYFDQGVAYWPGAKEHFTPLGGQVSGNVLVAFGFH
ncbi:MAG: hypothetical protein K2X66_05525, partial [Cyanobacteria bacterium]|nr:hypothetical protein [Cyanobacteriota bacterium]